MVILNTIQVKQKITRLAYEILENNIEVSELFLIGINSMGMAFANNLYLELQHISDLKVHLQHLTIDPKEPLLENITIDIDKKKLANKTIILIDDVANSGRTLFYACHTFMETLPQKVETAVLVNRTHKLFPIRINYVGLSLSTTLKENITIKVEENRFSAHLA